jgi:multidrug resistance protein
MLGYALGQLSLGILSDAIGRRPVVLWSGFLYVLASFGAAWSPHIEWLIFFRWLQGFSVAGPAAALRAVPTDAAQGHERMKMMTTMMTSWALGPVLGPFIGSYLEHLWGWHSNFYFLGIYAFLTTLFACLMLPETVSQRIKLSSTVLVNNFKTIFTHREFLRYISIATTVYITLVIFNGVGPFLIQTDLHYSVIVYGRVALTLGGSYFLGSLLIRSLIKKIPVLSFARWASRVTFLSTLILLGFHLFHEMSLWSILIPCMLLFFSCGILFPSLMSQVATIFPHIAGTASASYGFFLSFGVFVVSSLVSMLPMGSVIPLAVVYVLLHGVGVIYLRKAGK